MTPTTDLEKVRRMLERRERMRLRDWEYARNAHDEFGKSAASDFSAGMRYGAWAEASKALRALSRLEKKGGKR